MKTYLAKRTVNHNNQEYQAGEPLQLDDKTAAPLLTVGAVEEKPAEVVELVPIKTEDVVSNEDPGQELDADAQVDAAKEEIEPAKEKSSKKAK